ncbi:ABC transporter permease [Aquabacterium sp. OR-4]|uniref:ABC transporter permease n=1 Tax=Aquabacterium sp. OR-4 TaxID=2978127 RepID=UPI0021B41F20|nr:FtsX-like permease family protein [Aquabacterium sp. OR-4]MDT7837684.1 FtsX-like permease family protein [Aquabacterium sp. OR-4]
MNQTLSLALRNLLRNRRRSLATLLALAIGAASLLLFGGYTADIRLAMLTEYVRNGGHLQIQHRDYFLYGSGNPTAYAIRQNRRIEQAIAEDPALRGWVTVVTPMLQFGGVAGNYDAGVSRTVIGTGLIAADVTRMRQWNEFGSAQVSPPYVLDGAPADAAIVGTGVARVLLLCAALNITNCPKPETEKAPKGPSLDADIAALADLESKAPSKPSSKAQDKGRGGASAIAAPAPPHAPKAKIELLSGHGRGSPNVAALYVQAAENQGTKELDDIAIVLQFQQAQQLVFGRSEPRATAIMVQLARTADLPVAREALKALIARVAPDEPLALLDFIELNPFYTQTVQLFDTIFGFIFTLIGGIVLFTVTNTMNAAVVERTTEIGTLRAVGLRQAGIRQLFVTEGLVLGMAGAVAGITSALVISWIVNSLQLTWLPPGGSERLPLTVRVWGQGGMIALTAVGLVVIAALSAWWPARRAAQLKIVDALRHI